MTGAALSRGGGGGDDDDASSVHSSPASSFRSDSPSPSHRRRRHALLITTRNVSFLAAVLAALCGGSITAFSLYGHLFQERLHYSQYQVNGVSSIASFSLYLPVPLFGYICDRYGPARLSGAAAILFGAGYGLAAGIYKYGTQSAAARPGRGSYTLMMVAFVLIGVGTCALYICSIATCAKNFGKGKYRGLALAAPITAIGLSGLWESQVGSRLLYERLPDGSRGDVDCFLFFIFLAVLLFFVSAIGFFTMKVIDEQELIDEAVEELERSGLLDGSAFSSSSVRPQSSYGTLQQIDPEPTQEDTETSRLLDATKHSDDNHDGDEAATFKKNQVLNAETRRFLADNTTWLFAAGFFLAIGPAEAFINNMGTVLKTLYPPTELQLAPHVSAATHVSVICATSTAARLIVGALTDILAPSPATQHFQFPSPGAPQTMLQRMRFSVSRVTFIIFFALLLSLGMAVLASGAVQNHGERFWIVSSSIGAGYGALFSLAPIIVTIIWGVENFGTNWGIIATFPAVGNALWGAVYSAVYQAGAAKSADRAGAGDSESDLFCYGSQCYSAAYWGMAGSVWFACALILWAWRGKGGWTARGIVI
ncbi:major facilitator superfamily domain-containing protein [Coniella lustricola]|uniref:Probable transporter MCH1 n=1 Tax=Coniella lustricola TaxID=2025994 RepID=A0A2T3A4Z9_9PEZI|nr:major facilitator superfamily domain-containing protein [Coniella lustricola]